MADFETYNFFESQQDSDDEKTGVRPVARQADLSIDDWDGFGARLCRTCGSCAARIVIIGNG